MEELPERGGSFLFGGENKEKMNNKVKSILLFNIVKFFADYVRAVNIVYDKSSTAEEADYKALKSDWESVGRDILYSINKKDVN